MTLLTMRQYAIHRGVSVNAVSKAVMQGRITCARAENGNGLIDPAIADREWVANSAHAKIASNMEATAAPQISPPSSAEEAPKGPSYSRARAIRESFNARLAQLDYEEQIGKVVNAEEVRKKWIHIAGLVRSKVTGIPSKAKQRITDLKTEHYVELEAIVREALEDLAYGDN